jgi:hypothetical protein
MKRYGLCLGALLLLLGQMVAQDLVLDKLSDCDTLDSVQSMLEGSVSDSCRSPRDGAERKFMSQLQYVPRVKACLLSSPPTRRLMGFSCIDIAETGSRELVCYRTISHRALKQYQDNDDATLAYRYKKAAARCSSTNGDAADAPNSLFPQVLSVIGKPELGFIVGIGDERKPHTRAYHGFADPDPELHLSSSALEVFDMIQVKAGDGNSGENSTAEGEWKFDTIDAPPESQRDLARPFERVSGQRIGVRLRIIVINSARSSKIPYDTRKANLESWQQAIASNLEDQGFRSLTRAEMSSMPFSNTDQMRDFIAKHMPYGKREFGDRTLGPHLVLRVDDDDDDCNKIAEAIVAEPEQDVKNDFGGFGLSFFTIGRCRKAGGSDDILDTLVDDTTTIIEDGVKKQ